MPEKTIAEIIREKSQIYVDLPVAEERVYIRALAGWEMLAAGLRPLMISNEDLSKMSQQEGKERWAEIVTQARYVAVAVGISPKYSLHETNLKDTVCIKDLDDMDVIAIYKKAIQKTDARAQALYYGLNHQAFDPKEHFRLFMNQKEGAAWLYNLCHYHFPGLSPIELLNAPEWQIGVLEEMAKEGTATLIKDNPPSPEGVVSG